MPQQLRKVRAGDPLQISAATFNTLIDVAQDTLQNRSIVGRGSRPPSRTDLVLVRNDSGADRDRFDVLGVAGPLISPTDNASEFENRIALRGVTPTANHVGRFIVLAEPLPAGDIGRAFVSGVCPVRVTIADENHRAADISAGVTASLVSSAGGSAVLLWIEPEAERTTPGVAWALARLGGAELGVFPAQLVASGPGGEADYTDGRYWAREVTHTGSTDPTARMTLTFAAGGRWVTAHNLDEIFATNGYGQHLITRSTPLGTPTERVVLIRPLALAGGTRYLFNSHPGQIYPDLYAYAVSCIDGHGCPTGEWYKMLGPGFSGAAEPPACG